MNQELVNSLIEGLESEITNKEAYIEEYAKQINSLKVEIKELTNKRNKLVKLFEE